VRISIEFNPAFNHTKAELNRLIDRENFNEKLKTAIDNEKGLNVINWRGEWVYRIIIKEGKSE